MTGLTVSHMLVSDTKNSWVDETELPKCLSFPSKFIINFSTFRAVNPNVVKCLLILRGSNLLVFLKM